MCQLNQLFVTLSHHVCIDLDVTGYKFGKRLVRSPEPTLPQLSQRFLLVTDTHFAAVFQASERIECGLNFSLHEHFARVILGYERNYTP